jgi:hypothetical protein
MHEARLIVLTNMTDNPLAVLDPRTLRTYLREYKLSLLYMGKNKDICK